jgi:hypothetical protein
MKFSDFKGASKPGLLPWLAISLLAAACCILAVLQYRWINDFSAAQRDRLHEELQSRLNLLARSFNDEISSSAAALIPSLRSLDESGLPAAYTGRYESWKQSHPPLFRRIALAIPENRDVALWNLDLQTSQFERVDWPPEWSSEHARLLARLHHEMQFDRESSDLLEFAQLRAPRDREPHSEDHWLLAELNLD